MVPTSRWLSWDIDAAGITEASSTAMPPTAASCRFALINTVPTGALMALAAAAAVDAALRPGPVR